MSLTELSEKNVAKTAITKARKEWITLFFPNRLEYSNRPYNTAKTRRKVKIGLIKFNRLVSNAIVAIFYLLFPS